MKKFVVSAVVILFLGGIIGAGAYELENPGTRAKLENIFAALYNRVFDVSRVDHISSHPVANAKAVLPGTSINVKSVEAIRAMLKAGDFGKLNALLENYEKTLGVKDDLIDVYKAFQFSDPRIEDILSEWANKFPGNYEPYLARGVYYVNMAYVSRGAKYAKDTTKEQFANMNKYFSLARQDIDKVLKMKKGIVVPYYVLLQMCKASDDMSKDEALAILKKGLAIDPASFRIRSCYILNLTPRWGGSYQQMDAFAKKAQRYAGSNPKIASLRGYAYYDAGDMKIINHDYTAALALLDKAMTYGKNPLFLKDRARAFLNLQMPAEALKDINLAIALSPNDVEEYLIRAELLGTQGRLQGASQDIETADEIDPDKPIHKDYRSWVAYKLVYSGYQLQKKGDWTDAMGMFKLAVRTAPDYEYAYYWRAIAYVNEHNLDAADSDLRKAIQLKPDFFKAYYYLDNYVLSRKKDWPDIIAYWDKYIALHPEDGRAYVERGGAYYNSHNLVAAVKDAKRAADRGNAEGKKLYELFKNKVKAN